MPQRGAQEQSSYSTLHALLKHEVWRRRTRKQASAEHEVWSRRTQRHAASEG